MVGEGAGRLFVLLTSLQEGKGGWLHKFVTSNLAKSPLDCAVALEEDEDIAIRHNELARKA